jgi:hypothetical protein
MKKTRSDTELPGKKLALKREILRQLTRDDLGRVHGGTWPNVMIGPNGCFNPIYSA